MLGFGEAKGLYCRRWAAAEALSAVGSAPTLAVSNAQAGIRDFRDFAGQ